MYQKKNIKVAAIIAEYNPLHTGHVYHIAETKKQLQCDYCVVIMSGDYTQRGVPAIIDKYKRAECALYQGADLVLELPVIYSSSSANIFAKGAVSVLSKLNCVDYLSFGSECGDINALCSVAKLLTEQNDLLEKQIRSGLKKGLSYPASVFETYKDGNNANLLSSPNNLLGIEYIKAIIESGSNIEPFSVTRFSGDYNETSIDSNSKYTSSKAIRNSIFEGNDDYISFLPSDTRKLIVPPFVSEDDFSDVLYYSLCQNRDNLYKDILDGNESLNNKTANLLNDFKSFSDFAMKLKSKDLTYSRICRFLLHVLLDIKTDDITYNPTMVRILGLKKDAGELTGIIKKNSSIELISKLADANPDSIMQKDIDSAMLYNKIASNGLNEYKQSPVII